MEELEKIFNDMYMENKSDSEAVLEADNRMGAYIGQLGMNGEQVTTLDSLNADCTIAYEKQGFLNGFRCAVKLLTC